MISLATIALRHLEADFKRWGQTLGEEQEAVVRSFLSDLELGLHGQLPAKFHLLSLDPGMGKTSACIAFLKSWRLCGYRPASSILVGISTLKELQTFIDGADLPPADFGVLTGDDGMNSLGLPPERHQEAKVLFTSQAMIRSRTKGKRFADATDFFYQGKPRPLRIWDEDILPTEWRTVRLDDLAALASPLRPRFPKLVDELEAFKAIVEATEAGQIIQVPLGLQIPQPVLTAACGVVPSDRYETALETMQLMAGSQMLIQNGDRFGKELVGVRDALPDDLAPLIVVDASGRVRDAYAVWEQRRGNLKRIGSAGNSYHQLNVHHWQHGSGKDALEDDETRNKFAAAIVEAFRDRDPDGRWLILTHKDAIDPLKEAIEALDPPVGEDRLHWLHWGRHRSTNEYRDVEHIIIVGLNHYRQTDYLGLSFAAAGLPVSATDHPEPSILRRGELKHHLLQAVCRISARKAEGGIAAPANAFVIGKLADAEDLFESVFPGHSYVKWKEDEPDPSDRVQAAIGHVRAAIASGADSVRKKHLRETLGISTAQTLNKVLTNEAFVAFMREEGLVSQGQIIRPASSSFDPIEE